MKSETMRTEQARALDALAQSRTSPELMTVDPEAVCPECDGSTGQTPSMWPQGDPKAAPVCLDCYLSNHYQGE